MDLLAVFPAADRTQMYLDLACVSNVLLHQSPGLRWNCEVDAGVVKLKAAQSFDVNVSTPRSGHVPPFLKTISLSPYQHHSHARFLHHAKSYILPHQGCSKCNWNWTQLPHTQNREKADWPRR